MVAKPVYQMALSESSWMINRGNMKIGCGYKYNNLYPLTTINPNGKVNIAESLDSNIWHGRLGHMSQGRLDWLMAIGDIPKLQTKTDYCEHCYYMKRTRSPHSLQYEMSRISKSTCKIRGGTTGVLDLRETEDERPSITGFGVWLGHPPEHFQVRTRYNLMRERERERTQTQHLLSTRFLCTETGRKETHLTPIESQISTTLHTCIHKTTSYNVGFEPD